MKTLTPPKPNVLIKQAGMKDIPAIILKVPRKVGERCLAVPTNDPEGTLYDLLCTRIGLALCWRNTETSLGIVTLEILESPCPDKEAILEQRRVMESAMVRLKMTFPKLDWYAYGNAIYGGVPGNRIVDLAYGKGSWCAAIWVHGNQVSACHEEYFEAIRLARVGATATANADHARLLGRIELLKGE